MELEYTDSLTCAQLVKMITTPRTGEKHRKFEDVVDITLLKVVTNYAMKMRYVSYDGLRAVDREGYKTKR